MSIEQILQELIAERDRISSAIDALGTGGKASTASTRGPRTAEQRAAQGEKMRAYWAARKAGKKAPKAAK